MASTNPQDSLTLLYEKLMPVLARAAVGDFEAEIELEPVSDQRVMELAMGVQVLLDVIHELDEQVQELQTTGAGATRPGLLLDEVLRDSSTPSKN
jgi:exopolyphosphatase/pppGpp-phosphohydrolase